MQEVLGGLRKVRVIVTLGSERGQQWGRDRDEKRSLRALGYGLLYTVSTAMLTLR